MGADDRIVAWQLGRPPREPWRVCVRCEFGYPQVIASPSRLDDGKPFPHALLPHLSVPRRPRPPHSKRQAPRSSGRSGCAADESLARAMRVADTAYREARAVRERRGGRLCGRRHRGAARSSRHEMSARAHRRRACGYQRPCRARCGRLGRCTLQRRALLGRRQRAHTACRRGPPERRLPNGHARPPGSLRRGLARRTPGTGGMPHRRARSGTSLTLVERRTPPHAAFMCPHRVCQTVTRRE